MALNVEQIINSSARSSCGVELALEEKKEKKEKVPSPAVAYVVCWDVDRCKITHRTHIDESYKS